MSEFYRSDEGGIEDVPSPFVPQPTDAKFDGSQFELGDTVRPADSKQLLTVEAVDGQRITVSCVDRFSGGASEQFFAASTLRLVSKKAEKRSFELLTPTQLFERRPPKWLVRDILRQSELACLFGPPGSLKTFIAVDLSMSVALGREWCGHQVSPGTVVYIAAEGQYSVSLRLRAYLIGHSIKGQDWEANFRVVGEAPSLTGDDVHELAAAIRKLSLSPALIVVDTVARCMGDADENDARDMGRLIKSCDLLRGEFGCAVLAIHHSGKGNSTVERGSSALRGACDLMARTQRHPGDPGRVELVCEKQKEGESFRPMLFELKAESLDLDPDGYPVSAARVLFVERDANDAEDETVSDADNNQKILRALKEGFFEKGASASNLIAASGVARASAYRSIKKLCEKGLIRRIEKGRADTFVLTATGEEAVGRIGVPSLSLTSLSQSQETLRSQGPQSQSQSHSTPLGVEETRDGTETENYRLPIPQPNTKGASCAAGRGFDGDGGAP